MNTFLTLLIVAIVVALLAVVKLNTINFFFMKFFRDLSRYKARKRLYGNENTALMPILLGTEEPLPFNPDSVDVTVTHEELADMNGQTEDTPIYVAVNGLVFDVTAGRAMYGPGKHYYGFVGRDASRAYATGCLKPECFVSSLDGLTIEESRQADKWIEFYHNHDKYFYVGRLVGSPIDATIEKSLHEDELLKTYNEDERFGINDTVDGVSSIPDVDIIKRNEINNNEDTEIQES
eukprot:gene8391-11348_t